MKALYLDHNATVPLRPEARAKWLALSEESWAHARSLHGPGARARRALDEIVEGTAKALGTPPSSVVFTSGATEANLTALRSLTLELGDGEPVVWAVGGGEHPSATAALGRLAEEGLARVRTIRLLPSGAVDLGDLEDALSQAQALCLQMANHETGVLTDMEAVGHRVLEAGVVWHCDAVQAVGRVRFAFDSTGAGAMTSASLSGHKLGGPKGVGILLRRGRGLRPLLGGEDGDPSPRAGTPDVPGMGATLAALEASLRDLEAGVQEDVRAQRDALQTSLLESHEGALVHGRATGRLANTLSISLPAPDGSWPDGEELVIALATQGIACSTGAACATGTGRPSPVLTAMGAPAEIAAASLRLSLGAGIGDSDLRTTVTAIHAALEP
jgi:cysteine desulfurase